jgi:hypothetical protein
VTSKVSNPLLNQIVKLPSRYYVRVVVWRNREELHENTDLHPKDYRAAFIHSEGRCVGALNFAADDIGSGIRAHEIQHAVDRYMDLMHSEKRANTAELLTEEVDAALTEAAGLVGQPQII